MTGHVESRVVEDKGDAWYTAIGAALMVVYLAVDGLTSTWQDGLFQRYSMSICDQVSRLRFNGDFKLSLGLLFEGKRKCC